MGFNVNAADIFQEAPQPIVYMSRTAAERLINGYFPFQLFPLGGAEYRKSYEDLSLSEDQAQVFQMFNQNMLDYPYAVVTRNSLFFRSDDNCSMIGDTLEGIDISEACRNHDYCYRDIRNPMNSEGAHEDFIRCNDQLTADIIRICQENGKECSLGKIYGTFLSKMSYVVFRKRQSLQAEMVHNLLVKLKSIPQGLQTLVNSKMFNFSNQIAALHLYCTKVKWNLNAESIFYPAEKAACKDAASLP